MVKVIGEFMIKIIKEVLNEIINFRRKITIIIIKIEIIIIINNLLIRIETIIKIGIIITIIIKKVMIIMEVIKREILVNLEETTRNFTRKNNQMIGVLIRILFQKRIMEIQENTLKMINMKIENILKMIIIIVESIQDKTTMMNKNHQIITKNTEKAIKTLIEILKSKNLTKRKNTLNNTEKE